MKLVITPVLKGKLRVIVSQLAVGLILGTCTVAANSAQVLRELADEIDAQNS